MNPVFPPELMTGARNCIVNYGGVKQGDNVVMLVELGTRTDSDAIHALTTVCQEVGAEVQVVYTKRLLNSWWEELSPVVRAAIAEADVVVQNVDTIGRTHLVDIMVNKKTRRIRNYAADSVILSSDWARWPVELQDQVELRVNTLLQEATSYRIVTDAGTDIAGDISRNIAAWRKDQKRSGGMNVSFPPSVFRAQESVGANGVIAAEATYPWGARRYGLPETYFHDPVLLTVENNMVTNIEGGAEADGFRKAMEEAAESVGERAYYVDSWHSGISPKAFTPFAPKVDPDRWDHLMHNHENWFHFHVGGISTKDTSSDKHQKVEHVNAVGRNSTVWIDGELLAKNGRFVIWNDPDIIKIAEKYGDPQAMFAPTEVWV